MHPNRQKKVVEALLDGGEVAPTAQLYRLGLLRGAELLRLPTAERSMNTNGKGSLRNLNFVALTEAALARPTRDLGHRACKLELMLRRPFSPWEWAEVKRHNRRGPNAPSGRNGFPDWMLFNAETGAFGASVEIDVGYPRQVLHAKLHGADQQWRTPGYLYATTIHARVGWFAHLASEAHEKGQVPHLRWAEAHFTDIWSTRDPYTDRAHDQNFDHGVLGVSLEQVQPARQVRRPPQHRHQHWGPPADGLCLVPLMQAFDGRHARLTVPEVRVHERIGPDLRFPSVQWRRLVPGRTRGERQERVRGGSPRQATPPPEVRPDNVIPAVLKVAPHQVLVGPVDDAGRGSQVRLALTFTQHAARSHHLPTTASEGENVPCFRRHRLHVTCRDQFVPVPPTHHCAEIRREPRTVHREVPHRAQLSLCHA